MDKYIENLRMEKENGVVLLSQRERRMVLPGVVGGKNAEVLFSA